MTTATVERAQTPTERAMELIGIMARMDIDGECVSCRNDGNDPAPKNCVAHEPFDMSSDDAVEILNGLIASAREIVTANYIKRR